MITGDIQKLDPGAIVELFVLDTTTIPGCTDIYYFHAGTNDVSTDIVWQGHTYQRFPITASEFEMTSKGTLPRPTLTVANVTGFISAAVLAHEDLIGAKVSRHRTFARYLDNQPDADPDAEFPVDDFRIERKTQENKVSVTFELSSELDFQGVQIPARPITTTYCQWMYRGAECSYTGDAYFDVNDNEITDPTKDVCGKRMNSCKCRFGASAILPYGGFPAARTYK